MTKSELIEALVVESNLTKGRAELVVNTIFDAMVESLRRGEGIEIRGFGSFTVRSYRAYEGRNPKTGDRVHVSPKRLPYFKVGKELRERVNGGRPPQESSPSSSSASSTSSTVVENSRPQAPAPEPRPRARPDDSSSANEDVI